MASAVGEICPLCKESLAEGETVTVKSKGIKNIKAYSKQRQDGVADQLKGVQEVVLHVTCRKDYTKRVKKSENIDPGASPLLRPRDRFDFETCCTLCGKILTERDLVEKKASLAQTKDIGQSLYEASLRRTDDWGHIVRGRIESVGRNLFAVNARYHHKCSTAFRDPGRSLPALVSLQQVTPTPPVRPSSAGRRVDPAKSANFEALCKFLEENEECQFSLSELYAKLGESTSVYGARHLKRLLQAKYGDRMLFADLPGNESVLAFKGAAYKVLNAKWYASRKDDPSEERLRIVQMAANIIREDIRMQVYDCNRFPTLQEIENGGENMVPATLKCFLSIVIKTGKKGVDTAPLERKCTAVAHSIISTVRPRSFVSPLHLGLGVHLHRSFGSKDLLDILHSAGYCSSYSEVSRFESAVVTAPPPDVDPEAFVQYIFDNADCTVRTIDGHGTFHVTGGVACVTPAVSISVESSVPRTKDTEPASVRGKFGYMPLKTFKRFQKSGFDLVTIRNLSSLSASDPPVLRAVAAKDLNILWLAGFSFSTKPVPSWNGFMEVCTSNGEKLVKSAVVPLPFVNLEASNPSAILTCLEFAATECMKRGQRLCAVTFDQPLFHKATEIVLQCEPGSPCRSVEVIVRLGGLHTMMSYMGAIGYIMGGSGLSELWELVYAKKTVPHMLSGKAFSRAVRAHVLTQAAVFKLLLEDASFRTRIQIEKLFDDQLRSPGSPFSIEDKNLLKSIADTVHRATEDAKKGRTGKLWLLYIDMVNILKCYIAAERLGDWALHLQTVDEMLPIFNAAGHHNYSKSALLYRQQMAGLEVRLPVHEYDKYVGAGYFTVSRTGKAWSGISTDMIIEQNLMRAMKTHSGVTHGRGLTPSVLANFISTIPVCARVREAVEKFTGTAASTSEQHKDLRSSSKERDRSDFLKFSDWFSVHSPFEQPRDQLVSLSTGVVGNTTVNCDRALEFGQRAVASTVGRTFAELTYSKKNKVTPLSAMGKAVKVGESVVIPVNIGQIFHRLVLMLPEDKLEASFQYELAPYPPKVRGLLVCYSTW